MTTDNPPIPVTKPQPMAAAADARRIVRLGLKAALGTLRKGSNTPYVSLVTVATDAAGAPLILISRLAFHTQNLMVNSEASILFDATSPTGDPLAGGRVTLQGRFIPTTDANHRRRFLARQPNANMYADFPDFAFYKLDIESAHYIGGFGRIVDLVTSEMRLEDESTRALEAAEADIVAHMNDDHGATNALYAQAFYASSPSQQGTAQAASGKWTFTGLDAEGFDLVNFVIGQALRINFANPVATPNDARLEFVRLAKEARGLLENVTKS
jgi:heme iron utilization protein